MAEPLDVMPPAPPPPPTGGSRMGSGNPWERREELGFGTALIEALKLFIKSPAEAYSQTRRSGDFASPLLFALIVVWLGMAIQQIWSTLMGSSLLSMMPAEVRDQVGMYWAGSGVGLITTLIFAPFFILVGTFVWAAILHLLLLGGAARQSDSHRWWPGGRHLGPRARRDGDHRPASQLSGPGDRGALDSPGHMLRMRYGGRSPVRCRNRRDDRRRRLAL